ncbi:hypothetical protein GXP67_34065 [Rhodocytophaga rosea]|uniref:Uncharacterized protein n=1 Tax=Rhodocytophaga rosea TaxID=2704465 RepID=A0A6C0GTU0_9BACT|nr:hypothetical protein [Rhodocytophaga rosea]QHT71327.1 hypothetical protein GXP67_34065 [Rhodocytophaga rosea]
MERLPADKASTNNPPLYLSDMALYKIKLIKNISAREAWIPVNAHDIAQARNAATLKCTKTEFIPDYNSLQVIDEEEYELICRQEFRK